MKKQDFNLEKAIEIFKNRKISTAKMLCIFLGASAVFLLIASWGSFNNSNKVNEETGTVQQTATQGTYLQSTQEQLVDILASMQGVGNVKVMITLESSAEEIYAQTIVHEENQTQNGENIYSNRTVEQNSYVLVDTSEGRTALTTGTLEPVVKGVVVVCEGAGDVSVERKVTEVVCVVLGITSNRVCVTKLN